MGIVSGSPPGPEPLRWGKRRSCRLNSWRHSWCSYPNFPSRWWWFGRPGGRLVKHANRPAQSHHCQGLLARWADTWTQGDLNSVRGVFINDFRLFGACNLCWNHGIMPAPPWRTMTYKRHCGPRHPPRILHADCRCNLIQRVVLGKIRAQGSNKPELLARRQSCGVPGFPSPLVSGADRPNRVWTPLRRCSASRKHVIVHTAGKG